jgi:DNA modification methylase
VNLVQDPHLQAYDAFLKAKVCQAPSFGFEVPDEAVSPVLKPFQRAVVRWAVRGGRRALFESFGLGKTLQQLEVVRIIRERVGGLALITMPLNVRHEFAHDAAMLGTPVRFIQSEAEIHDDRTIYLTNYETVREGKLDPKRFTVASLDEAAILRGFGGTKTFREFMKLFAGDDRSGVRTPGVPYRFVATATPSPNEFIELLAYAAYLDIMDVSAAKTRFFKRDSTKADNLTLHGHKEAEFWLWVASWAIFLTKPSDLGPEYSDEGYELPPLDIRWHEIPTDHEMAGHETDGQARMFKDAALGVVEAAREKRESLDARVVRARAIVDESPEEHFILWHDLEAERAAIEDAFPGVVSVYGTLGLEEREQAIVDFAEGRTQLLAAKPVMLGSGCNLQRHCHRAVFVGIGFKFSDFIQAIHRIQRFLQAHAVRIDLIYTEAEREVRRSLLRKWRQHEEVMRRMTEIIREYGLANAGAAERLTRSMGVGERLEVVGDGYRLINNDCVIETRGMESDSVGLVLTSIPFSTQYEYSPNYADFGHTDTNEHFFQQLDFLTPELFRVLQPGRIAAIHVKDRLVPTGMNGLGFQVVYPFHARCIDHYTRHGFGFIGMKTIVTDVVRENNQTYRLGWSEQCKDGTKMGVGMPEYLLLFRKPPTDSSNMYADVPVLKSKPLVETEDGTTAPYGGSEERRPIVPGSGYSRSRWQIDAHGFARSAGDRRPRPEEIVNLDHDVIFRLFRDFSIATVYDFEHHVRLSEELERKLRLPTTFMLLQPQSWHPDVWTDITRMLTANTTANAHGREQHLCPMQFDLADRVIAQMSNPGDVVYDPFGGTLTVVERAIRQRRRGVACELARNYFLDGVAYVRATAEALAMPTLFDLIHAEATEPGVPAEQ